MEYAWGAATITVGQIRKLGGFDAGQQVVEVNLKDNTERTLAEGEVVQLKPGHGFGKKVRFKRGVTFHSSCPNNAYCRWCSLLGALENSSNSSAAPNSTKQFEPGSPLLAMTAAISMTVAVPLPLS